VAVSARGCDFHVLAHDELELAAQAGLDGGEIDLALALGGIGVASREQRSPLNKWSRARFATGFYNPEL
jgi:hypothetical protein